MTWGIVIDLRRFFTKISIAFFVLVLVALACAATMTHEQPQFPQSLDPTPTPKINSFI